MEKIGKRKKFGKITFSGFGGDIKTFEKQFERIKGSMPGPSNLDL